MATFNPRALLKDDAPSAWSSPVPIAYDQRDVLLYAVGIGCNDLRFTFEGHPQFAVFPSFAIRWGSAGLQIDRTAVPSSPGPLMIDAERCIEQLAPLPLPPGIGAGQATTVQVRSRLLAVHPRGKGGAFTEFETEVLDAAGTVCMRVTTGLFQRGVAALGDIAPFDGAGVSRSVKTTVPQRPADVTASAHIPDQQAALYRLSGDYNPLHIDPEAARFGGFPAPILHGLCTYGHIAQLLVGAVCGGEPARFGALRGRFSAPVYPGDTLQVLGWRDDAHASPGRLLIEARVLGGVAGDRTVFNNAYFEHR